MLEDWEKRTTSTTKKGVLRECNKKRNGADYIKWKGVGLITKKTLGLFFGWPAGAQIFEHFTPTIVVLCFLFFWNARRGKTLELLRRTCFFHVFLFWAARRGNMFKQFCQQLMKIVTNVKSIMSGCVFLVAEGLCPWVCSSK